MPGYLLGQSIGQAVLLQASKQPHLIGPGNT
jgi:hypothetical protein